MKAVFLFFTLLAIVCVGAIDVLETLKQLSKEQQNELCDSINHPSHSLFSPIRCLKEGEDTDFGKSGRKFKATHNIDAANLNPVVLFPGLGGSALDAQAHKEHAPSWYCWKNFDWVRLWFAVEELLVQPCWMDNLAVYYNSSGYFNTYGVDIVPADFGGITGVAYLDYIFGFPNPLTSIYSSIIKSLEEIGYKAGVNLHGAPFDWRYPATYAEKIGYFQLVKELIQNTSAANGNLPVHIVTHSMGGPTALYFLNSMPDSWVQQYVASFNPIAGPWTGAPNALRAVLSGDNFGLSFIGLDILSKTRIRDIARNAGGVISLVPNTDLQTADVPFVNNGVRNYTIAEFPQLFADMGLPTTGTIYGTVSTLVENLHAPGVPVNCAYGKGVDTEHFYTYANADYNQDPVMTFDDGDGTVPLYSLQECQSWAKAQSQPVDVQEFDLTGHSDILHDDEFIQYLLGKITNQ